MSIEYTLDLDQINYFGDSERLVISSWLQQDVESHAHNFFELVYVTGGTAIHILSGEKSLLATGDYFIVDYGSVHSYSESRDFQIINCLFLPEIIDDTLYGCRSFDTLIQNCLIRYYSPSIQHTPVNRIFHDDDGRILALLVGMQDEYREKKAGFNEVFRCRLIEILVLTLRRIIPASKRWPKSTAVLSIVQYVDRNYSKSLTLSSFCEEYHYNLQYMSRKFKQETGFTFREYLQKVRIEKSCSLLAGSDMWIQDIAQAVGYDDIKFFCQIFKKLLNMPPREYRKISGTYSGRMSNKHNEQ